MGRRGALLALLAGLAIVGWAARDEGWLRDVRAGRLQTGDLLCVAVACGALGAAAWAAVAVHRREPGARPRIAFWMSAPASLALAFVLALTEAYFQGPPRYGPSASPEPAAVWIDWWQRHCVLTLWAALVALLSFLVYGAGRAGWAMLAMRRTGLLGVSLALLSSVVHSRAW